MNQIINGLAEGHWEEYHSNGNLWYKAYYVNSRLKGYYECYYSSGELFSKGYYNDNLAEGYWIDNSRQIIYI